MSMLRDLARAHERRIAAAVAAHQGGRLAAWTRAQHADPDRELVALLCGPRLTVTLTKRGVPAHEAWQLSQRAQTLADDGEFTALAELLRDRDVDLHADLLSVTVAGVAEKARAWVKRWGMRPYVEDVSWVDASEEDEDADFGDFEDGDGDGENEPRARTNGGASTTPSAAPVTAAATGFSDGLFDAADDEPTRELNSSSAGDRPASHTDSLDDETTKVGSAGLPLRAAVALSASHPSGDEGLMGGA